MGRILKFLDDLLFENQELKEKAKIRSTAIQETWLWKRCKDQELYILKLQNQLNQTQRKRRYEP